MRSRQALTEKQISQFLEEGYLIVEDCLDPAVIKEWTRRAYDRLGYDPATWEKEIVWMDRQTTAPVRELSPRAWEALCDVVGGADRIETEVMAIESSHFTTMNSCEWSDAFIVNFRRGADQGWVAPSATSGGWHKDGSFFRHFLDSREQALLTIVLWSDVGHQGGGTFIAPDSIGVVARYLRDHPEGAESNAFGSLIDQCRDFREITGPAGTFIILHPFMLHASSNNLSGNPRFMINPPILLKEHMDLNRSRKEEHSLLELATLHALGSDGVDFKPTTPRRSDWWIVE